MLIKFNNFISDQELSYIESIVGSPRWRWGHKSNPTDTQAFWQIDDLKDDETYQDAIKAIKNGYTIINGSFSSDGDDAIEQMLCNDGLVKFINDKNIIVILNEGR